MSIPAATPSPFAQLSNLPPSTTAPQPSQNDELVYSRIMDACSGIGESRIDTVVYAALAAARAEATLAERERDGTWERLSRETAECLKQAITDNAAKDAQIAALKAIAEAYEQWEADLILSGDWRNEMPRLTQPIYDRMMEIQAMRNAALAPGLARAALEMSGGVL